MMIFESGEKTKAVLNLTNLVSEKDKTYSPLALYFLIDKNLVKGKEKINKMFNTLIEIKSLETEIKNLIIYKKALYNADIASESELIRILNPIINSESIWKSHSLYLMAQFFDSKSEKQKANEFYKKILLLSNSNEDIRLETQKILNRNFSE